MARLSEENFKKLLEAIHAPKDANVDFLYECFCDAMDNSHFLKEENPVLARIPLNPLLLTLYIVNEHYFYLLAHQDKKEKELIKSEEYESLLLSIAVDKYYTNEHFSYKNGNFANRFNPEMSTIALYINFVLGMLSRYKQGDPRETLVVDILNKGFSMSQCIVTLLIGGYETEAFSTWRTLHENECILQCILAYGQPVVDAYLRHLRYAMAFRGGIPSKKETDAVFLEIKEGMRENNLKSKDMKRFIEYGWLSAIGDVKEGKIDDFKFNFRDGVERVAGLRQYSKVYEMSSEIAHSSPLLIYSHKGYFYLISAINLYESFFRIEKVFSSLYLRSVNDEEKNRYLAMRKLYYAQLLACYNLLKKRLAMFSKTSKAENLDAKA